MKAQKVSRGIAVLFNLSARLRWVINAELQTLYSRQRDPIPIVLKTG